MPHQCTTCDRSFPDGSKAMLGGCPDCGGNKFQFLPSGAFDGSTAGEPAGSSQPGPSAPAGGSASRGVTGSTASEPTATDEDILEAPSEPAPDSSDSDGPEDAAQASARRSFVSREELPSVDDRAAVLEEVARDSRPGEPEGESSEPTTEQRPDLETLRRELNDQFESIRIVEPGQYELNLMELYDREEYIIALKEDGRYVIDVPARWSEEPGD